MREKERGGVGGAHLMGGADLQIIGVAVCSLCYVLTRNREVLETHA